MDDREIFLLDTVLFHRTSEPARSGRGFRDQDEAASFAIEPVDDGNLPAIDQLKSKQLAQRRPESRGAVRFARMNEQERWLVDHKVIVRLIDDPEVERKPCLLRSRK